MHMTQTLTHDDIAALYEKPFNDLLWHAQTVHRKHFDANEIQLSTLLSIKTGACPEDCAYCPQSGHYNTGLKKEKLMDRTLILANAKAAKARGATRFCMGAAWRNLPKKAQPEIEAIIKDVKALGLETCMTLGMLEPEQAQDLQKAGLDYYNHNLDSSPEYYEKIITTRTYQDRLDTLAHVRNAGMKTCCGGIIGMGESREDRVGLIYQLTNMPEPPTSVPINYLIPIEGTPLANTNTIDDIEFVRTIAVARITMPRSYVRLSAGRETMAEATQALCFLAGANSIFYGDVLLTANNQALTDDNAMLEKLGIRTQTFNQKAAAA